MEIEGATALITGASSGIGAALARAMVARGATVGIVARRRDKLDAVLEQCRATNPACRSWVADLGDVIRQVAAKQGVQVQDDPEPQRNVFARSDQYSFIRAGVPSLSMKVGFVIGSKEHQIQKDWLTNRYHAPSDDLDQPVDLASAGKYEDIIRLLLIKVANDPNRPQWKTDSFFRRYAEAAKN